MRQSDLSQRYLLGLRLGPTSPCPSTVHMESYSASVFCVSMRCRLDCDISLHCLLVPTESSLLPPRSALGLSIARRLAPSGFRSSPTPSYAPSTVCHEVCVYIDAGEPSADCFSIVHFRGWSIRQVSCYTLLGRFQLPWPRPCCLDEPTPFRFSLAVRAVRLGPLSVHPASPILLTKTGPLRVR